MLSECLLLHFPYPLQLNSRRATVTAPTCGNCKVEKQLQERSVLSPEPTADPRSFPPTAQRSCLLKGWYKQRPTTHKAIAGQLGPQAYVFPMLLSNKLVPCSSQVGLFSCSLHTKYSSDKIHNALTFHCLEHNCVSSNKDCQRISALFGMLKLSHNISTAACTGISLQT